MYLHANNIHPDITSTAKFVLQINIHLTHLHEIIFRHGTKELSQGICSILPIQSLFQYGPVG